MAASQMSEEEALTEGAVETEMLDWRATQEFEERNVTSYLFTLLLKDLWESGT